MTCCCAQGSQNAVQTGEYNNKLSVMVVTLSPEDNFNVARQRWAVCALHVVKKLCSSLLSFKCIFVAKTSEQVMATITSHRGPEANKLTTYHLLTLVGAVPTPGHPYSSTG